MPLNLAQAMSAGLATAGTRPLLGLLDASGRGRPLILTGEQIAAQATGWQQRFVEAGLSTIQMSYGDYYLKSFKRDLARYCVEKGISVHGIDLSQAMVERLRAKPDG